MDSDSPQSPDAGRRIYPLSPRDLSEEQIAVTFARTSRSPEPFDEIAARVSADVAADFHERWVLGYGHASVAEHAVLHLAVENISRLACDTLENNRLASYTEKSSRYQVIDRGSFHVPRELNDHRELRSQYVAACRRLFDTYHRLLDAVTGHLRDTEPQGEGESDRAYHLRLRRLATDVSRAILPAATLTNVGVTANARTLEHAISKLMSSRLAEERAIGEEIREQGRTITPTLVKYADYNPFFAASYDSPTRASGPLDAYRPEPSTPHPQSVELVDYDADAPRQLAAALLYRGGGSYADALATAGAMSSDDRFAVIQGAVRNIGPHDPAPREFELVGYTYEFTFDYGAWREFRRHRMQTPLSQPLTIVNGYEIPPLIESAGAGAQFEQAIADTEPVFRRLRDEFPPVAQYLVTHAHRQRILSRLNLRECYHLFKLRSSNEAHESIRRPMLEAMHLAVDVQPEFFRHLRLRDYPDWWPFPPA